MFRLGRSNRPPEVDHAGNISVAPGAARRRHPSVSCALIASMRTTVLLASAALLAWPPPRMRRGGGTTRRGAARSRPDVVLLVLDEFPGDSLLDSRGRIDPVRYPELRRAGLRRHVVPQRLLGVRLHHQGRAADPRRPAPGARLVRGPALPSAIDLRRPRPSRLPHGEQRGGHRALPAESLSRRAHPPAGDHPAAERGPRVSASTASSGASGPGRGPRSG